MAARRTFVIWIYITATGCTSFVGFGDVRFGEPDAATRDAGLHDTDASVDAGRRDSDASIGEVDAGPPPPVLLALEGERIVPADLLCLGLRRAPVGMETVSVTAVVEEAFSNPPATVDLLAVVFSPVNLGYFSESCLTGGECQSVSSSDGGQITLTGSRGAWSSYRVLPANINRDGTPEVWAASQEINVVTSDGMTVRAVRQSTVDVLATLAGVERDSTDGLLIGNLEDCAGRPLVNAEVRLFDSTGAIPSAPAATGSRTRTFFFARGIPSTRETRSTTEGRFGVLNVPVPASMEVRVEVWGSTSDGEPARIVGCEWVPVSPDTTSFITIGPLRTDGCGS